MPDTSQLDLEKEAAVGDFEEAVAFITDLNGIGPVTASLILSTLNPVQIPFFSDVLFDFGGGYGTFGRDDASKGYQIKHPLAEYRTLFTKVKEIRQRIADDPADKGKVSALDLEMTAHVLAPGFVSAQPTGRKKTSRRRLQRRDERC